MTKIKEEQFDQLKSLRDAQTKLRLELGDLDLTANKIKLRKEELIAQSVEEEAKMEEFISEIRNEYGDGSVDINTGEFTPSPEEV